MSETGNTWGPARYGAFDGWAVDHDFQRALAPHIEALERDRRIERGRAILDDTVLLSTLPAAIVVEAQLATAAEREARAQLEAAEGRADAWEREYKPSVLFGRQKREEFTLEAATAVRHAEQQTAAALDRLTTVATQAAAARQVLRHADTRREAAEQRYQAELRQIEQDALKARNELRALNLT